MASNKSPVTKTAAIAMALTGESNSQIAENLGISRPTVAKILIEADFANLVSQGKADVFRMIPEATAAIRKAIKRGKTTEEAQLVLRSTGVLAPEESNNTSVQVNLGVFPDRD